MIKEESSNFDEILKNSPKFMNKLNHVENKSDEIIEHRNGTQILELDELTSEIKAILFQTNEIIKLVENNKFDIF